MSEYHIIPSIFSDHIGMSLEINYKLKLKNTQMHED